MGIGSLVPGAVRTRRLEGLLRVSVPTRHRITQVTSLTPSMSMVDSGNGPESMQAGAGAQTSSPNLSTPSLPSSAAESI
jgi:hypothetical protein